MSSYISEEMFRRVESSEKLKGGLSDEKRVELLEVFRDFMKDRAFTQGLEDAFRDSENLTAFNRKIEVIEKGVISIIYRDGIFQEIFKQFSKDSKYGQL